MSNMVVRTNVFALNAHRNLTNVGLQQMRAASRLSSGYRINSAADDAAGLAISESMRAQIRGLTQASINTQDGVALIQTAEGAMSTISDMIIRVRELMVQAANDTNTPENRGMIQLEIDQIMEEINDVTFRTQFNTRTLLDGGLTGGGGQTSSVSLQWMVFNEARLIGLPHPGATIGPGGMHPNPNNVNDTSLRAQIINIQQEMNALAMRVADRLVAQGAMTTGDRNNLFADHPFDFSMISTGVGTSRGMVPAEYAEMRGLQNRLDGLLRQALSTAESVFQTTQDQINALGGRDALNNDGSRVFLQATTDAWGVVEEDDGALAMFNRILEEILGRDPALNISLANPAPGSLIHQLSNDVDNLQELNQFIFDLVGYPGAFEAGTPGIPEIPGSWEWQPATGGAVFDFYAEAPDLTDAAWLETIVSQLDGTTSMAQTQVVNYGPFELAWTPSATPPGGPPQGSWNLTQTRANPGSGDLGYLTVVGDTARAPNGAFIDLQGRSWVFDPHNGGTGSDPLLEGNTTGSAGWVLVTPNTDPANVPETPAVPANTVFVRAGDLESFNTQLSALRQAELERVAALDPPEEPDWATALAQSEFDGITFANAPGRDPAEEYVDVSRLMHNAGFNVNVPGSYEGRWIWTPATPPVAAVPPPTVEEGNWHGPLLDDIESLFNLSMDVLADVNLESNAMWFQIGANANQGMMLQLRGMHTGVLGGGRGDLAMLIDVRNDSGIPISEQLTLIRLAEESINSQRAQLGAIQNRLEFTRQSLDVSTENLSGAESRIRDADMAREMMTFTAANVLQQAATSMLAQANQLPNRILELLR